MTRLAWAPLSWKRLTASVWLRLLKMVLWAMVSGLVLPPLEVVPLTWSPRFPAICRPDSVAPLPETSTYPAGFQAQPGPW